ncbi:sugar porter (SP) family MFS transporter [Tamaricihabitans halophyticus]|uniref:Sugar porter (SP) family MFS transporter n=1 Tax=Tamaricihabitans halophyticus TaxID=1262583 RepID=A0A4R2QVS2_9PSEU|nr:sugar porter family MFS transporter [Tamaricihabitans halophyticus]TCP54182.1 sugar porter (SP) family MFS transporter [Tamaricihabitans halophyticus]
MTGSGSASRFATYFFGALGGLLFGYDLGVVAGALLLIEPQFGLSPLQTGFVTSSLLVGGMIGALTAGRLADRQGRRGLVLLAGGVFTVGCLVAALANSFELIVTGRFVMGLAVGALAATVPIYLAELAPARHRGALSGLNQLMISTGILVAYLVNLAFDDGSGWRWSFGIAVVPAVVLLIGVYLQPESPRWLVKAGRAEEARAILASRGNEHEFAELEQLAASHGVRTKAMELLRDRRLRRILVIGVGVAFLQQILGINTIIYYAPTILVDLGFEDSAALLANAGLGLLTVIVTVVMLLLVDRIGRRRPLIFGAVGMSGCMATLGLVYFTGGITGGGAAGWLAFGSLALFKVFFSLSWGGMVWILLGEIFPLRVREPAMGIATFMNWTGNLLVGLFFPVLLAIGTGGVFFLFAAVGVLCCVFAIGMVPETKGKTLEQIEREQTRASAPQH